MEKQIRHLPNQATINWCIGLIVSANLLCLSWNLFPEKVPMGVFWDGHNYGYTLQWYIKSSSEILRLAVVYFSAGLLLVKWSAKLSMYFWILLCYESASLFLFFYNANEFKTPNVVCACILLTWSIISIYPRSKGELRAVK